MIKHSQPHRPPNGPVRLDRLVKVCLGKAVARQGFGSAEILTAWPDIVGPELAVRTRPERIRWPRRARDETVTATLVVRAEGGDALEIQHMTGEILARLNGYLGWAAVGKLVVRQAPVAPVGEAGRHRPPPAAKTTPASGPLAGIEDSGLRDALLRLARARARDPDNSA